VRFQVLTAASMKIAVFWVVPTFQRCLVLEAANTPETSETLSIKTFYSFVLCSFCVIFPTEYENFMCWSKSNLRVNQVCLCVYILPESSQIII
jgi:glucan phosphoethanolaminetransferase (alkaline phosphatase superfamily)